MKDTAQKHIPLLGDKEEKAGMEKKHLSGRVSHLIYIGLFLSLLFVSATALHAEQMSGKGWKARIDARRGTLTEFTVLVGGKEEIIPFRKDSMEGPAFEGVCLKAAPGGKYVGRLGDVALTMHYEPAGDHLKVVCTAKNEGQVTFSPLRLRLHIGADAEMHTYPGWDDKFFPTLMRCEKNFAWGYLMSPRGIILTLGLEDPAASYALDYINEGKKEWNWGHQILTESFDLLHCLPLPSRHPQNLTSLSPGETRTWTLHIGGAPRLADVKTRLSHWLQVPLMEAERYTLAPGEENAVTIMSPSGIRSLSLVSPDGKTERLSFRRDGRDKFKTVLQMPHGVGVFRLTAVAKNGKQSEANLYVRHPWAWYLDKARNWVSDYPPLAGGSAEQYYGYYAAALGARCVPDKQRDEALEKTFEQRVCLLIDTAEGTPLNARVLPKRVQNFSSIAGMLVDYWRATGKRKYLVWASRIGDFLCSPGVQWADGSYRSNGTHYTAVIYPAKSMMELAAAEKEAARQDTSWLSRSERHLRSALSAAEDLAKRLDNIETEGDMTFEDGMITCSALQMGLAGLTAPDTACRARMTKGARYMMEKHRCLEQRLIPDCRMRGATLRFWESLDVYFSPNQVMDSPHGWTSWKIYAVYYLYLLTGEERYLSDMMDAMGACMQVVDGDGRIRWGFIPDPYVDSRVCVPDKEDPRKWTYADSIVGEQYLNLISSWSRPADENQLCDFGGCGGAGDNTVFEMFKALEECVLRTAFVIVRPDGSVGAWNCRAVLKKGLLEVTGTERGVRQVHVNTSRLLSVSLLSQKRNVEVRRGMQMIPLP